LQTDKIAPTFEINYKGTSSQHSLRFVLIHFTSGTPSKETCHCGLEKSATFPVSFQ